MMRQGITRAALLALALLLGAVPALAGSLSLQPIRIDLGAKTPTAVLTVRNGGKSATVVQLSLVKWTMADGKDVHTPSQDVIATPPIFTVPAGGKQIVRLGLRHPAAAPTEGAYRLIVQQPPSEDPDHPGVKMMLRLSLPVFVAPAGSPAPKLAWRLTGLGNGSVKLEAINTGNVHVRLNQVTLSTADGKAVWKAKRFDYVLPGATLAWTIKGTAIPQAAQLRVSAATDTPKHEIHVPVALTSP